MSPVYNTAGEEMVVVEGKTYDCREELKAIGGIWYPREKVWRVPIKQRFVAELIVNNHSNQDND